MKFFQFVAKCMNVCEPVRLEQCLSYEACLLKGCYLHFVSFTVMATLCHIQQQCPLLCFSIYMYIPPAIPQYYIPLASLLPILRSLTIHT